MPDIMQKRKLIFIWLVIPVLILLALLVYQIPAVKSRIAPRIDNIWTQIQYQLNPPDEAIFVPEMVAVLERHAS